MTFLHPEFLYITLLPVLVLFFFLLRHKAMPERYFVSPVLEKLRVSGNGLTQQARNALFFIVSLLIVVALAQPVIEEGNVTVQAKSADIMIALDISESMRAEDVYPNRLERAKQKVLELLEQVSGERIGVMAFAKSAYLVSPLSFDHAAVSFLVKQLRPEYITEQGTDFSVLLDAAENTLRHNEHRYLLLLTDGGDDEDFSEEIALAKAKGIRVFVLGIGTEKGAPIKQRDGGFIQFDGNIVISRLNGSVADFATGTGGAYIASVASSKDVEAMLAEILGKTEKKTLAEEEIPMYTQLFYYPAGLALLVLLLATSSMYRKPASLLLAAGVVAALLSPRSVEADLLDFRLLDEAKQAYEAGDFAKSAEEYDAYGKGRATPEADYNRANALYRQGDYAAAAKVYEGLRAQEGDMGFSALHNLGNALAKQGSPESLPKAVEAYETALERKEDPQTRENLEMVKKLLEQQQKEQPSQGEGDSEQKKEQEKQEGESKQQTQQEASKEQEAQQEKKSPPPEEKKKAPEKPENGEASPQPKDEKKAQQRDSENEQKPPREQDAPKEPEGEAAEPPKQVKSEKPEEEEAPQEGAEQAAEDWQPDRMSEREAAKWLKMLEERPAAHIYRLSPEKPAQEDTNEKPW